VPDQKAADAIKPTTHQTNNAALLISFRLFDAI
jgi:hypothetical protein